MRRKAISRLLVLLELIKESEVLKLGGCGKHPLYNPLQGGCFPQPPCFKSVLPTCSDLSELFSTFQFNQKTAYFPKEHAVYNTLTYF